MIRESKPSRVASRQTGVDNTSSQKTRAERKQMIKYPTMHQLRYKIGKRAKGVIQVLRNARGGGWVYAQALRSVTRGWGGGLRQRYVTSFFC